MSTVFSLSVLKCGVGIANDAIRLNEGYKVETKGLIELQHLAFRCGVTGSRSLKGLTELITGYHISKSAGLSNWEVDSLSLHQIRRAASDAIASLTIMEKLVSKELSESNGIPNTKNILQGTIIGCVAYPWSTDQALTESVHTSNPFVTFQHTPCHITTPSVNNLSDNTRDPFRKLFRY